MTLSERCCCYGCITVAVLGLEMLTFDKLFCSYHGFKVLIDYLKTHKLVVKTNGIVYYRVSRALIIVLSIYISEKKFP